ncbi:alpha-galactosidase [Puccinia sorghi]|uniref:Alpha-galactosidase n=1 Tax=Puccinia sorghi TaxID=27349 RepID=A0A0L6UY47_9BASI|nr:alpha-galactosidase [Puccinia sorghi]
MTRMWTVKDLWNSSVPIGIRRVRNTHNYQIPVTMSPNYEDLQLILNDIPSHGVKLLKLTEQVRILKSTFSLPAMFPPLTR